MGALAGYILVLEHQAPARRLITKVLTQTGYAVLEAAHAQAGEVLIREYAAEVRLVIVDLFLPDIAGLDFANWLDREYPEHAPVLYISGASSAIAVDGLRCRHPEIVLLKPFTRLELLRRVEFLLTHRVADQPEPPSPRHRSAGVGGRL